ncbi:MAG: mobile mystery protein A [Crocinitomicaceae bacterium]|nr:MAG: mobile mystery protein A [Crocinitomicaceae bacterium]
MKKKSLQIQQIDSKMLQYTVLQKVIIPSGGWIKNVREALGMSMQQLGNKLGITKQSVHHIERREAEGSITLRALKDAATAMDMQLVYGFVPNDGSLEKLIERKARELAMRIVARTNTSMVLEDQGISEERLDKAVDERVKAIINEMPKALWD